MHLICGKGYGFTGGYAYGRVLFFLIIDTEIMAVEVGENPAATAAHGTGIAAARRKEQRIIP